VSVTVTVVLTPPPLELYEDPEADPEAEQVESLAGYVTYSMTLPTLHPVRLVTRRYCCAFVWLAKKKSLVLGYVISLAVSSIMQYPGRVCLVAFTGPEQLASV